MNFVLTKLALGTLLLVTTSSLSLSSTPPVQAAVNFGQQDVNQDRFIIVALPRSGGSAYNLMILEQLSNQRLCWQVNNNTAQTVNLLLLKFNFTGICGRSTDSNSYSLRMAGQDLGLVYTLRLVRRDGVLVLVGTPSRRSLPEVEIGRTQGLVAEPMRIVLDPGWRLAKRTFKGTVLQHVYFATDTDLSTIAARNTQPAPPTTPTVPRIPPVTPTPPAPEPAPTVPIVVTPPPTPSAPAPQVPRIPAPTPPSVPRAPQPTTPPANDTATQVNQIYRELLGREADPAGLAYYVGRVNQGVPLSEVRRAIANSPEAQARLQVSQPIAVEPGTPSQPITVPPPATATPTLTTEVTSSLADSNAYFVVIPGSPQKLAAIAQQIWQLGIEWKDIAQRPTPRGPHVAIGPFNQRGTAEQMSTYLRSYGLDARVYFGR